MFLTVTPNSAVDKVIFIDEFRPETVMRTRRHNLSVGGKGFDTSVAFRSLQVETLAVGFVAGSAGKLLQQLLDAYGIQHDLVWVGGETRASHVIIETALHRMSHIMVGELRISEQHCVELVDRVRTHLNQAKWLVCAGSIPSGMSPTIFRDLIDLAHQHNVPTLIDSSGAPLREAFQSRPRIVKMNRDEFYATFDTPQGGLDRLIQEAQQRRHDLPCDSLVITCGADGILAFTADGNFHVTAPLQKIVNAAGAGDATSAALIWRLSQGDDWESALQWAAATGAATVLTEATAESRMDDVVRIKPEVQVRRL